MNGRRRNSRQRQCGAVAMIAVGFLVILALIGGYVMNTAQVQQMTGYLSWQSMQAWFAARSAVEYALDGATRSQVSHDALCGSPALTTPLTLTLSGLDYAVTIACDDAGGFVEAGTAYEVDFIRVTATRGTAGQADFVSRTIYAQATRGEPLP